MMTGSEIEAVWSVVGKIGVAVGVIVALVKGLEYLWSKHPTSKLELRVNEIETHEKNDFEHFKAIDSRINTVEEKMQRSEEKIKHIDDGITRIGKSQISLLRHFANGNGKDEMNDEAEELTDYFITRKGEG